MTSNQNKKTIAAVCLLLVALLAVGWRWQQVRAETQKQAQARAQFAGGPGGPGGGPGGPGGGQGGGANRLNQMSKELNLTPAQTEQVKALFSSVRAQMPRPAPGTNLSAEQRAERRKQRKALMDAGMATILTPEQKAKFDTMQQQQQPPQQSSPPPIK